MRHIAAACILLAVLMHFFEGAKSQQCNDLRPSWNKVAEHFDRTYDATEWGSVFFSLEKRKDGWYVSRKGDDLETVVDRQKIWDCGSGTFVALNYRPYPSGKQREPFLTKKGLSYNDSIHFRNYEYFGYAEWPKDVISEFGNRQDLDDNTLYTVAMAYYEISILSATYPHISLERLSVAPKKRYNGVRDKSMLDKYLYYRRKELSALRVLAKRNPAFQTILGTVPTKLANEIMDGYLQAAVYWGIAAADTLPLAAEFEPLFLYNAKNILTACERNSILFAKGDNETYPLLYLQVKERFRTDVSVVNLDLLNIPEYIAFINKSHWGSQGVPVKYPVGKSDQEALGYVPFYDRGLEDAVDAGELLDFIYSDDPDSKVKTMSGDFISYYPTQRVEVSVSSPSATVSDSLGTSISITLPATYLDRSDMVLLDIITQNIGSRPLYFCYSIPVSEYYGLKDYLRLNGLVCSLETSRCETENEYTTCNDTASLFQNFMERFDYSYLVKECRDPENMKRLLVNYKIELAAFANELVANGEYQKAMSVVRKAYQIAPERLSEYGYFDLSLAAVVYGCADGLVSQSTACNQLADSICLQVAMRSSIVINHTLNTPKSIRTDKEERLLQQHIYILNSVKEILASNERTDLAARASRELDRFIKILGW